MTKQKGFTREFEDEAVRLARTNGRTRRELAENRGCWPLNADPLDCPESRPPDRCSREVPSQNMTAELKRLRRENEILRQEHDSLKKATAFFAREKSR